MRTPNPAPGQKLPLPNHSGVVRQLATERPDLLASSCQNEGGSWAFMDELVRRLRRFDTRYGNNGKRGNINDPSKDVVAYNYSSGPDEGTTQVYIIDVIGGHCGRNPQPAWIDQTAATAAAGSIGRWMLRAEVGNGGGNGGEVPIEPPKGLTRAEVQAMIDASLVNVAKYGEKVALQASSGKILCAEQGGPTENHEAFNLTSRSDVGLWESWKLHRGN